MDLVKAFDSVPRDSLYIVLGNLGIPPKMTRIIMRFHSDLINTRMELENGMRLLYNVFKRFGLTCHVGRNKSKSKTEPVTEATSPPPSQDSRGQESDMKMQTPGQF
jgi:hypothetical protein